MIKRLLLVFIAAVLVGCGSFVKTETKDVIIYKKEYVYVAVPAHLLKPNKVPSPPDRVLYLDSSMEDKEGLLINYGQDLVTELRMCNADKKSITKIIQEKIKKEPTK